MELIDRLKTIEEQFEELTRKLSDPSVLADQAEYTRLARSHAELSELAGKIGEYRAALAAVGEAKEMLAEDHDEEMDRYLKAELHEQTERRDRLEVELREMLVTKDPNDAKDVIMEIRAGAGGQEASLFAGDLYRMYTRYAEEQRWKSEVLSSSPSDVGGFKEIIFEIKGRGAYSRLKYESGVHRVQRIPVTESGGRIHTSTATVAVLPEVEDVEVEVNPQDIRIDIFRSSGPGGQSVNTTDSAVRVTHIPTGLVVSCQEERSQLQNRDRAMRILRARIYEKARDEQAASVAEERRSQVGTGDRSERIRTYNFPQNRVTDHRIGMTMHDLGGFLEGNLGKLIETLAAADRAESMKEVV